MHEVFELYEWTLLGGAAVAGVLGLIGAQLAARDRAMQTVCVGQGATLGVILGLGGIHLFLLPEWTESLFPFFTALATSILTYVVSDRLAKRKVASRNTIFAFFLGLLLALTYLLSALFPGLETHLSQVYFGDLSTLSTLESKVCLGVALPVLVFLSLGWRAISNHSFELALFGEKRNEAGLYRTSFNLIALFLICYSVQFLGYLFTISALFVPTAILSFSAKKGLRFHLVGCVVVAILGTMFGFIASLYVTRLPTVPSIVVAMFLIGVTMSTVGRAFAKVQRADSALPLEPAPLPTE